MKNQDPFSRLRPFLAPGILILLGLTALVKPDAAAALVTKFLGWIVLAVGIGFGLAMLAEPRRTLGQLLKALFCLWLGTWLLRNPLNLAASLGRLTGLLLFAKGLGDVIGQRRNLRGLFPPLVTVLAGIVLMALPLTTTRLMLSACGIALLAVGITMLASRLRMQRLQEPDDPNIIDAL